MKMSKWVPTTDLMMLRRMGKLQEEMSELGSVAARCIIQGIDEVDPSSGKVNRERLWIEIADVYAQLDETVSRLGLNTADIETRRAEKRGYMQEWEAVFSPEQAVGITTSTVHSLLRSVRPFGELHESDYERMRDALLAVWPSVPEQPEPESADDHCTCQGCGNKSTGDLLVPDDVWAKITPKPETPEAGILCPNCIVKRITDGGIGSGLRAYDVDAPIEPKTASADAEDAARYRWLRDPGTDVAKVIDKVTGESVRGLNDEFRGYDYEYLAGVELDAAIDAARAAKEDKT